MTNEQALKLIKYNARLVDVLNKHTEHIDALRNEVTELRQQLATLKRTVSYIPNNPMNYWG